MSGPVQRRRRGIATVEFALVAPLILLLQAGVLDFSMLLRTATCVTEAARVGSAYGSQSTAASLDTAGIQAAARNAAPNVSGLTAVAARTCKCSDGSSVSCTGTCGAGTVAIYVEVTASANAHTVFNYTPLHVPNAVTGKSVMRVR